MTLAHLDGIPTRRIGTRKLSEPGFSGLGDCLDLQIIRIMVIGLILRI
jgi:hypothetical protein